MATGKSAEDITPPPSICLRIGQKVRSLRIKKGWSERMLADHAQIEQAHLARLETAQIDPGVLERLAIALGIETF